MNTKDPFQAVAQKKNAWMITFTDLLSLLITFFIMIYSISETSEGKWHEMTGALVTKFHPKFKPAYIAPRLLDVDYLYRILKEKFSKSPEFSFVSIVNTGDAVVVSIPIKQLFDNDQPTLIYKALMYFVGEVLLDIKNDVQVYNFYQSQDFAHALGRANMVATDMERVTLIESINAFAKRHEYNTIKASDMLDYISIVIEDD